jgi:hypothetical protein
MALITLGTNAVTSLQAARYAGPGSISNIDSGNLDNLIKDDKINSHMISFDNLSSGVLFVPNRGYLQILPGDYIGVDANGWPILVSAYSIATGGWTHT